MPLQGAEESLDTAAKQKNTAGVLEQYKLSCFFSGFGFLGQNDDCLGAGQEQCFGCPSILMFGHGQICW